MQFWPRKRAKRILARVRSWPTINQAKPLGFLGYKVGMTHVMAVDNRPKSMTVNDTIAIPTTIIECPPIKVMGLVFYGYGLSGWHTTATILANPLDAELQRAIQLPKQKSSATIPDSFDDLRLLVFSQPSLTTIGTKKPTIWELPLGGSKEEKLAYAQEKLGKEIRVEEVFQGGHLVDIHGVTKGKGFQGTVKRYGVDIRHHKSEKTKRGIGSLGPWHPKRVMYHVPQPGKMGFHRRTEYNKQILKVGNKPEELRPNGGFNHYGLIQSPYLLLKGSVPGPTKRLLTLIPAIRPPRKVTKEAPDIISLAL